MKKNVIALLLSVVLATGSIGTVPVMAAETVVQDEALGETEETGDAAFASEEVEGAEADAEQQIVAAPETSTEVAEEEPEQDQEEPAGEGEEQEKETLEEQEESAVESDTSAAIAGVEDAEDAKADAEQQDESLPETSIEVAEEEPEKGQGETLEEPEEPDMESDTSAAIFGTGEPEDAEADAEQQAASDSETSTEVAEEEPEQWQKETLEEPEESAVESDTSAAIAGTEEAAAAEEELLVGEAKLAGDVVDSGICGGDATWKLTGTDSDLTLTISGSGDMKDFDKSSIPWETKKDKIKTIVVEDGITRVGNYAFYSLNNTTSVLLGGKVSSIGFYAFSNCVSLKSVTIPGSMIYISDCAFEDCTSLASITIPDGVISIGDHTFAGCTSLASITIPDGVTSIGYNTFADCSSLISITIPDGVKEINDCAFENCRSLKNVTIPDSVMSIGDGVFAGCSSLTSVRIPDSVTSIGFGVFSACSSLTSVRIPDSVTSIEKLVFYGCSSLTSVRIPDSVTYIEDAAFQNCSSLASITFPDGVISIGSAAFSGCSSLKSITVPDSVISIGSVAFSDCSSLKSITIPDGVTRIENNAFYGCSSLVSITIPNRVTSIGEFAINSCSSLTSVRIPVSVTSIGYFAFFGCRNLKTVYYDGTKAEWDAIEKDDSRLDINNLVLHTSDGVFGSVRAEKIALNKTSATLVKGASLQLKATVTPADAADGTVTWKSSNTKVATVTSTGKVKAVSAGTTTITAMTGEGKLKVSCTIKVVNPFTINFNKNATKATLKTSSKKVNPGSAIGELPTPNYSGYYFNGWYTEKKGGTKVTTKTKPSKSMTLYAHWVERRSLKKAKITVGSCTYNTKAQKPKVTVKYGSKTLKEGSNYTLTYTNNKNASKKAAVIVKGKNAYKDSVKKTFAINQRDISKSPVSITLKKNKFGYTGKTIKPGYTVAITVGGKAVNLANGTDFTVAYKNNVKIGTASIVFKGKGNYKGAKTLKFYILKKATVTLNLNKGSNSRVTPVLPKGSKNTVGILAGEKIGKIPTPTRKGYTFVGWFTTPKATGGTQIKPEKTRFDAGETKNQTIYARWKKNVYKITFKYDGNGLGLYCPFSTPKERTYTVEDTVTLPVLTSEYARFNGWKNTPGPVNSDKLIKKIGEKATTGNQVLYLDYTLYKYSIEFSGSDGGTVSNGSKQYETMLETHALPKAEFLPPAGKTFDKWYCTEDGKYYEDGAIINRLTTQDGKVFHFVAVWKDDKGMQVVNYAREWVGKIPYNSPGSGSYCVVSELTSTDCSGFVCGVYLYFDVNLWPKKGEIRNSPLVTNIGTTDYNQAKPGDIIWWKETKTGLGDGHVAIYAGDGYMIEETSGGHDGVYGNVMVSLVSRIANSRPVSGIFRVFND